MVFQYHASLPWLTVSDNVALELSDNSSITVAKKTYVRSLLDLVGLASYSDCFPRELSGGMCQRVGMVRALASMPTLLLLDEPFSSLDAITAEKLRYELKQQWKTNKIPVKSMLMVTHNLDEALYLSDRIIILGGSPSTINEIIDINEYPPGALPSFKKHLLNSF